MGRIWQLGIIACFTYHSFVYFLLHGESFPITLKAT
jgi:hypothetical protein